MDGEETNEAYWYDAWNSVVILIEGCDYVLERYMLSVLEIRQEKMYYVKEYVTYDCKYLKIFKIWFFFCGL